jgi:hypothetical protein
MTWEGKSLAETCTQLKDQRRNGGRDLAAVLKHATGDCLVKWGWNPGPGREPAPTTNAKFGALLAACVQTGGHCPLR